MTGYLVDTNIVLRFLRQDDQVQSAASNRLFSAAADGRVSLRITVPVLAECVWVFRSGYKESAEKTAVTLDRLITRPGVVTDELDQCRQTLTRLAMSGVDYTDCYLAAIASREGYAVATFDRDFRHFDDVKRWQADASV